MTIQLSKYASDLQSAEQTRYLCKIALIGNDPFVMRLNEQELPKNLTYLDLYEYLVNTKSYYTFNAFKAFKSLEAYKLYEGGWVQHLGGNKTSHGFIVLGKVYHSQSLNAKTLSSWVHIRSDGTIINGHCDCVAGLGECCSHVGAVLFALHALNKNLTEKEPQQSVTDIKAYWVVPGCKNVLQQCNEDIKYSKSKQNMVGLLNKLIAQNQAPVAMLGLDAFLRDDNADTVDIEIEFLMQFYLANLYQPKYEAEDLATLIGKFDADDFKMSKEHANLVEKETITQSSCSYWYKLRIGRITASIFKTVCRAKSPVSLSIIQNICYPSKNVSAVAVEYGQKTEQTAFKSLKMYKKEHTNLNIALCGLFINCGKSYYAASPDGIWTCTCCGRFPVEIKCPYILKDGDIDGYINNPNCPVILNSNGQYEMKQNHSYYYQIQLQGYILECTFVIFSIYSSKIKILIKVTVDYNFVEAQIKIADEKFKKYIFPELIGKYFSNNS